MPSIDYPSSPIAGQTATYSNGNVVIYDGSAWRSTTTTLPTGTSSVYFGFNGFISAGLSYTKIADNTVPASGQISFTTSDGDYFSIYVSKTTSNGENVSSLLSSITSPVTFTLQNE